MSQTEENAALRVDLGPIDFIQQFTEVLLDLDRAYNALYTFLDFTEDIEQLLIGRPVWRDLLWAWHGPLVRMPAGPGRSKVGATIIAQVEDFSTFVLPSDRLVLKACHIGSPGLMDIVGKLNPLKIVRDWHEMRKDREYREGLEKEKLRLENELLRNEVIRGRIEILEKLRYSRTFIKQAVNVLLNEPIRSLEQHVDSGRIRRLELLPLNANKAEGGK